MLVINNRQEFNVAVFVFDDDGLVQISRFGVGGRQFEDLVQIDQRREEVTDSVRRRVFVGLDQVRVPVLDSGVLDPGNEILKRTTYRPTLDN